MTARRAPWRSAAGLQRGFFGVAALGWLLLAALALTLLLKVAPGMSEHARLHTVVRGIAAASPADARAVQEAFDAQKSTQRIESIAGRDLVVTREEGILVISYAYDFKAVLFGPVSLLIRYEGTTREAAQ
jgi:hypothetical protein